MSFKTTLPASGLAVAVGAGNVSALSALKKNIEELKASIPTKKNHETNQDINLFGSKYHLGSIPSSENPELESLFKRVSDLDHEMSVVSGRGVDAGAMSRNIDEIAKKLDGLEKSIAGIAFDAEMLSDFAPSASEFVTKWDSLATKAYVDEDESILQINDCNIGFMNNRGSKSSIRFAGLDDPNWSMYTSSTSGKSTDDLPPSSHSGVTSNAIRMRLGINSSDSVIIETPEKSLLHIESDGKTNVMSTSSGGLGSPSSEVAGFSHKNRFNMNDFAVCQDTEGSTKINSKLGTDLILSSNTTPLVTIKSGHSQTMEIENSTGPNTTFNSYGKNTIYSLSKTRIRSGVSDTDRLLVDSQGVSVEGALYVDDINVNEMIRVLKFRLAEAERRWQE